MTLFAPKLVLEPGAMVHVKVPNPERPLGPLKLAPAKVIAPANDQNDPEGYFRRTYGDGYWLDLYQEGQPTTARLFGDEEQSIRGMYVRYFAETEIDAEERLPFHRLPTAGDWSDEDFYNGERDTYDPRKLRLDCPHCGRPISPLLSPSLLLHDSGWRWVGVDHKEPYGSYRARCPRSKGCGREFRFTLHTPQ